MAEISIGRKNEPDPSDCCQACGKKDEGYYVLQISDHRHLLCDECMVGLADMLNPGKFGLSLRHARKRLREKTA